MISTDETYGVCAVCTHTTTTPECPTEAPGSASPLVPQAGAIDYQQMATGLRKARNVLQKDDAVIH